MAKLLDLIVCVRGFIKYSKGLLEFSLKLNIVLKHLLNVVFVVLFVYILDKVGLNLFSSSATHVASYKRRVFNSVQVLAVKLKVEVELEDPFLKLSSISIVKVRSSNLIAASLSFVRGIY